jgi:hypothetical protein
MGIVPLKEAKIIFVVDNLDFGIRNVAFEAKVFNSFFSSLNSKIVGANMIMDFYG